MNNYVVYTKVKTKGTQPMEQQSSKTRQISFMDRECFGGSIKNRLFIPEDGRKLHGLSNLVFYQFFA